MSIPLPRYVFRGEYNNFEKVVIRTVLSIVSPSLFTSRFVDVALVQAEGDDPTDNSDSDMDGSDSDFEPIKTNGGKGKAKRSVTGGGGGGGGSKGRGRKGAGPKKRGGRWGGGRAGSNPSALLENPYADGKPGATKKKAGERRKEESDEEMDGVVEVLCGGRRVGAGDGEGAGAVGVVGSRKGMEERGRGGGGGVGGTLVVCPLSLIGQWRAELESKTRKGAIAVCFHYGAGRSRFGRGPDVRVVVWMLTGFFFFAPRSLGVVAFPSGRNVDMCFCRGVRARCVCGKGGDGGACVVDVQRCVVWWANFLPSGGSTSVGFCPPSPPPAVLCIVHPLDV